MRADKGGQKLIPICGLLLRAFGISPLRCSDGSFPDPGELTHLSLHKRPGGLLLEFSISDPAHLQAVGPAAMTLFQVHRHPSLGTKAAPPPAPKDAPFQSTPRKAEALPSPAPYFYGFSNHAAPQQVLGKLRSKLPSQTERAKKSVLNKSCKNAHLTSHLQSCDRAIAIRPAACIAA